MSSCVSGLHDHRDCKRAQNLGVITIEQWCDPCLQRAAKAHINKTNAELRMARRPTSTGKGER